MQRHVHLTSLWLWRRGGHAAGRLLPPRLAPRPRLSPMQSGDPRQLDGVDTADGPPRSCVDGSRPVPALPFVRPTANPSCVRRQSRSTSNSAKVARLLKNILASGDSCRDARTTDGKKFRACR
jgi:hypothetical protein